MNEKSAVLSAVIRERRSVRDFLPDEVPGALLEQVLEDASWAPSWSNTQPYRVAIASGELKARLKEELAARFDFGIRAEAGGWPSKLRMLLTRKGLPDGDFSTRFAYPGELLPARRATGFGLYKLLGIDRKDREARNRQMRRNFEFFGAPAVMFLFVHKGLREFSVLDAGIWLQTVMLSAQAHGLGTCAQGALATWAGPVKQAFAVPKDYKLICGLSIGYASGDPVNTYNPGRGATRDMRIEARAA